MLSFMSYVNQRIYRSPVRTVTQREILLSNRQKWESCLHGWYPLITVVFVLMRIFCHIFVNISEGSISQNSLQIWLKMAYPQKSNFAKCSSHVFSAVSILAGGDFSFENWNDSVYRSIQRAKEDAQALAFSLELHKNSINFILNTLS